MQFDKDVSERATGSASALDMADLSHRYLWLANAVDQLMADEQLQGLSQFSSDENGTVPLVSAGTVVWTLGDQQGTIKDLAVTENGTTSIVTHRVYDSYGNLISSSGTVDCLFGYTGFAWDKGSETYRSQTRPYDPLTGRWIQEDLIVLNGNDTNINRYCGNSPVNATDPTGLTSLDVAVNNLKGYLDELLVNSTKLTGDTLAAFVNEVIYLKLLSTKEIKTGAAIDVVIPLGTIAGLPATATVKVIITYLKATTQADRSTSYNVKWIIENNVTLGKLGCADALLTQLKIVDKIIEESGIKKDVKDIKDHVFRDVKDFFTAPLNGQRIRNASDDIVGLKDLAVRKVNGVVKLFTSTWSILSNNGYITNTTAKGTAVVSVKLSGIEIAKLPIAYHGGQATTGKWVYIDHAMQQVLGQYMDLLDITAWQNKLDVLFATLHAELLKGNPLAFENFASSLKNLVSNAGNISLPLTIDINYKINGSGTFVIKNKLTN